MRSATGESAQQPVYVTSVADPAGGGASQIQGNSSAGSTDTGNPVKVGGVYNSTLPTLTDGQRGNFQIGTGGSLNVQLMVPDNTSPIATSGDSADGQATSTSSRFQVVARLFCFNGANWDRLRGDLSGVYSVASPSASAATAIVAQFGAGITGLVVKNAPGNFFSASMTAGATAGFFVAINATAIPAADAAISPVFLKSVAANADAAFDAGAIADRFSTGIVLLFTTSATTYTVPANPAIQMRGKGI